MRLVDPNPSTMTTAKPGAFGAELVTSLRPFARTLSSSLSIRSSFRSIQPPYSFFYPQLIHIYPTAVSLSWPAISSPTAPAESYPPSGVCASSLTTPPSSTRSTASTSGNTTPTRTTTSPCPRSASAPRATAGRSRVTGLVGPPWWS